MNRLRSLCPKLRISVTLLALSTLPLAAIHAEVGATERMAIDAARFVGIRPPEAALSTGIQRVVPRGAEKEVVRANAARVVTVVANIHTGRNGSVVQFPRKPVGCYNYVRFALKKSVSVRLFSGNPFPAAIRLLYFSPESFLDSHTINLVSIVDFGNGTPG